MTEQHEEARASGETLLPLLTAAEMRDWERRCFVEGGISERVVLESAGRVAALAISRYYPEGRVVAAVGKGNNGGDAMVALRTLRAAGRDVIAVMVGAEGSHSALAHEWSIPSIRFVDPEPFTTAGVLIDGLLGTGASGAPREPISAAIAAINRSGRRVIALDGPSGVDLSTGEVAGDAVHADLTITFGAAKRGLLLYPGRKHAGRILVAEVGFPPMRGEGWDSAVITDGWARSSLPRIEADAHKGQVGLVAVVAGRKGVGGAAIMAAMGALRAGTGGVHLVSSDDNRIILQTAVPEAIFYDREDPRLADALERVTSVLIGPGIGTGDGAKELLRRILDLRRPTVLDADALTILSQNPDLLDGERAHPVVLTPHPGELGRLLQVPTAEVLRDRVAAANRAAERYRCTVLSKGAPSIVASTKEPTLFGMTGHSGVATGGMGDTLGGIVACFLGAGADGRGAAALGLHFAGLAAEVAGRGRGLLPRDVAEALPEAIEAHRWPTPEPPFVLDLTASR